MDVAGLKPDVKATGTPNHDGPRLSTRELPCSSVAGHNEFNTLSPAQPEVNTKHSFSMTKQRGNLGDLKSTSACRRSLSKNLSNCKVDQYASTSKDESSSSQCPLTSSNAEIPKREGDVEFELQLEMALSATAAEIHERTLLHVRHFCVRYSYNTKINPLVLPLLAHLMAHSNRRTHVGRRMPYA